MDLLKLFVPNTMVYTCSITTNHIGTNRWHYESIVCIMSQHIAHLSCIHKNTFGTLQFMFVHFHMPQPITTDLFLQAIIIPIIPLYLL